MAVSLANSSASRLRVDPFDPMSAPCGSHEWIRKVLCFPRNLVVPELHDAHCFSDHPRNSFFWACKKPFGLLLRVAVSRIVFRTEVFQSKRPRRCYLRDVLAGFRPVEMGRVARENDHGAGRI